jgi:histidine ammonia-lyase
MDDGPLVLDGRGLSLEDVEAVARRLRPVGLGEGARAAIEAARAVVEAAAAGDSPVYGVNTGFGSLARQRIAPAELRQVQRNLVRSHAAGVGDPLGEDVVRAMLLILAASLSRGRSGVRIGVIESVIGALNRRVCPLVPGRGSVGASGDLAPLAHAALVLLGEGEALVDGAPIPGAAALERAGLAPLELEAREGLALINGTHLMAAMAALALRDTERIFDAAVAAGALAIDACRATDAFLDDRLHQARGQAGQREVAQRLRRKLEGSQIVRAHRVNDPRVQDPYSLRAMPQVLGAALDAIRFAAQIVERELAGVTDNPLIFAGRGGDTAAIVSGGNFHGMPLAIALDLLAIALCHVAGIAERRMYWLLAGTDSENPVGPYLSPRPGLHSGFMIVQYTAAACCNELQTLAAPASVGNIPTSAGMEDYNSMGATSAHQAAAAVRLARDVVACELLVMGEALDHQRPLRSGAGVEETHAAVRTVVRRLTEDRPPAPDIAALSELIRQGRFAG